MTDTTAIHNFSPRPAPTAQHPTTKDLLRFVVIARRGIRRATAAMDSHRDRVRHYRRQARLLRERTTRFDAHRIAAFEAAATAVTEAYQPLCESLKASGQLIVDAARLVDAGTTLAQRCEILNVNMAERADLTEADGLVRIVFGRGLEDSAARRKVERNDGPLYRAMQPVFMDFLSNTREGQELGDSLFEPGGLLAGAPMHVQAADGSMKRLPPRLHVVPAVMPSAGATL